MYYIKNGIKEYYSQGGLGGGGGDGGGGGGGGKQNYKSLSVKGSSGKLPTWLYILLGLLASLVAIWLIYFLYKKNKY